MFKIMETSSHAFKQKENKYMQYYLIFVVGKMYIYALKKG